MLNPDFQINYSARGRAETESRPTPERAPVSPFPLSLSLSGICPFTNTYTLLFSTPPLRRGSGTRKLETAPPPNGDFHRNHPHRLGTRDNITTRGCFCSINQLYRPCGHPPAFPQHAHHDWWTNCTTNRGLTCKNTCTRSKTGPSTHARQRSRAAHNRKSGRERRTRTTKTRQKSLPGPMWMILHRWV